MPERRIRAHLRRRRLVDEQFWPVFAAMLALGLSLTAIASAYLSTDDERWYANSWTWCFIISGFTAVATCLLKIGGRRRRRHGIQLALVLCAVLHLFLFVAAVETRIFARWWDEATLAQLEEKELIVSPDYRQPTSDSADGQLSQLRQPVDAETPDPPSATLEQELVDVPIELEQATVDSQQPEITPHTPARREATAALPRMGDAQRAVRRAETPAEAKILSEAEVPPEFTEAMEAPQIAASAAPAPRRANAPAEVARAGAQAPDPRLLVSPRRAAAVIRNDQPEAVEQELAARYARRNSAPSALSIETGVASEADNSATTAESSSAIPLSVRAGGLSRTQREPTLQRSAAAALAAGGASVPLDVQPRSAPRRSAAAPIEAVAADARAASPGRSQLAGQLPLDTRIPLGTDLPTERSERSPSELLDAAGTRPADSPRSRDSTSSIARLHRVEDGAAPAPRIVVTPGVRSRRTAPDSREVLPQTSRFRRRNLAGAPPPSRTAIVVPTESFRQRAGRLTEGAPPSGQAGPETEEAIELGLAFLAAHQLSDGRWSLSGFNEPVALSSDTAATGLALLAFQGAGYSHLQHKYASVVERGIAFLRRHQRADGDLFRPLDDDANRSVWLYSHGIASLALNEAYGMTQDPELRQPAQSAINFIVAAQDQENGGWRYSPGISSDTSVTGWMLMALKSGQLADLRVPDRCWQLVRRWLDLSQASGDESHLYRYNPFAPDTPSQRHGRVASQTMTSVGLLMRLYEGWRRDDAAMRRGAEYLRARLPTLGSPGDPQRDTYYWYYGTQVMFHMQGEYWVEWHQALKPLLIERQVKQGSLAGSWDPQGPIPDRWATHAGRLYVTTLNLLSLEVHYRHLPIYEETGR